MKFSRVLFVDNDGVHLYDPQVHRRRVVKFLAWDGLLITGGQDQHSALWNDANRHEQMSRINTESPLVAAGHCMGDGLIAGWTTYGYRFTTPEEMKPYVCEVLEMHSFDHGDTSSQRAARKIMGKNFLGVPEVVEHFGAISPADLITLQTIPFDEETLKACAKTHILVADVGRSLLDVRKKARNGRFYKQVWFEGEEFAKRTETARWRLIRKTPVDDSFSKNWSEQQALIDSQIDEIPSTRQVVYMMTLHFLATGERLFEKVYVRTSDVDSNGLDVGVGYFVEDGLFVNLWYNHVRVSRIGVASARKT